ncbi:MAG TPA: cytochrome C oxidase subunit IV family protein [Phycisphaerales bacterium]|nr:cytochrome C oxidase subunit IV family protein [Phycisphaerales bacterium]
MASAHHPGPGPHGAHAPPSGAAAASDVLDIYPAGAADSHGHHGHVIIPGTTLVLVLAALLFFTLLTVGASQAEMLMSQAFGIVIPGWVNVLVALSIAAVKTALVVLFFMGLKYDDPINSMVFLFTLGTVAFFMGFIMTDVGNRSTIDRFKGQYIVEGGTGGIKWYNGQDIQGPITEWARTQAANTHAAGGHGGAEVTGHGSTAGHGPHARDGGPERSSPEMSRPVRGVTLPGLKPAEPATDGAHSPDAPGTPGHQHDVPPAPPTAPPTGSMPPGHNTPPAGARPPAGGH